MNIGSLADESGYRRMITPKGLLVTISKQTHSGKSGCLTDEAGVSRTPNENTGATYYTIMKICINLHLSMSVLITMYRRSMYLISPPSLRF